MFVVVSVLACAAGWLAYSIRWRQQRRDTIEIDRSYRVVQGYQICMPEELQTAPFSLRIIGDYSYQSVDVYFPSASAQAQETDRIRRLSPEAKISDPVLSSPQIQEADRIRRLFPEAKINVGLLDPMFFPDPDTTRRRPAMQLIRLLE